MKKLFSKLKNAKGFTLVEMIVVMAIIGILVALLAPNVAALIRDARETSDDSKTKNISTAVSAYATKLIKDGYTLDTSALGTLQTIDAANKVYVFGITPTAASPMDTQIRLGWLDADGQPNTVPIVGGSEGYLPANVVADNETIYIYLSEDGNPLGVAYVDDTDIVRSIQTSIPLGGAGSTFSVTRTTGGTAVTAGMLDNTTARRLETTDGFKFAP